MFSGIPQSQMSPDFLRQLSMLGISGLNNTGGSNVQGQDQGFFGGDMGGGTTPRGGMDASGGGYVGGESGLRSMSPMNP